MKKVVFSLLLTILLVGAHGTASAQGQWVNAAVGIRPDSPFYILERIREKIELFFTLDLRAKAEKAFGFAAERLAEAEAMLTFNNTPAALDSIKRYESFLLRGRDYLQKAEAQGREVHNLKVKETEATIREQALLQNILGRVPEESQAVVLKAIDTSQEIFTLTSQPLAKEEAEEILRRTEESIPQLEDRLPGEFLPAFLKLKEATTEAGASEP
jgi:hypothetical protein